MGARVDGFAEAMVQIAKQFDPELILPLWKCVPAKQAITSV
jgi:hypothetical protein